MKLSEAPAVVFFNVKKSSTISCDVLQSGLSLCFLCIKTRYAQIGASVFKFHKYICGSRVRPQNVEDNNTQKQLLSPSERVVQSSGQEGLAKTWEELMGRCETCQWYHESKL